jgi:lipoate-protein ligase B
MEVLLFNNNEKTENNLLEKNIILDKIKSNAVSQPLNFIYLGVQDYNIMWKVQKEVHELVKNNSIPGVVLFLEHNHVYTFGKNSNKDFLLNSYPPNTQVIESDRGGQITYHGPGQLVGYPIINLNNFKKSVSWYMRSLEKVIIATLKEFGINGKRKDDMTGVWVDNNKVCAMGVRLSKWTSMHGFALNINPDMKYFDFMIPCGIFDYGVTSILDILGYKISNKRLVNILSSKFLEVFQRLN